MYMYRYVAVAYCCYKILETNKFKTYVLEAN